MLQRIREKISGWIAYLILGLLALVFAVWGIDIGFSTRTQAAVVNGDEIPVAPVRQAIQNQLARFQQTYGAEVPPALEQGIRDQVIEGFVRNRLLVQRVQEQGYRVSDEALSRSITEIPSFQVGGKFDLQAYRVMLANSGYTPTRFEAELRQDLKVGQLRDGVASSAFVTDADLARQVRLQREQRVVAWLTVPAEQYLDSVTVTEEQVAAEYEANEARYSTPESVDVEYLELSLREISAAVSIGEDELRDFYETEVAREPDLFRTPEQRHARHILVAVDEDTDEVEAELEIRKIAARVAAGEDFAGLARELSDDAGSAAQGGDLGWVEPGVMVPPFEEALFAMEPGTVSEPVRTNFGWHLIKLEEVRPGQVKTFEEAEDELREMLATQRAEERYYQQADTLERLAFENPGSLQPAADALGVEPRRIEGLTRAGGVGVASNPDFLAAAFSENVMAGGENSAAMELEDGHAVVLRVTAHHPAQKKPLDEVRAQIEDRLRREAAREAAREDARALAERLAGGASGAELAAETEAVWNEPRMITRQATGVPGVVRDAAFTLAAPEDAPVTDTVPMVDGSWSVVAVSEAVPGKLDSLSETERSALRAQVRAQLGAGDLAAYVTELRQSADVVINREPFE